MSLSPQSPEAKPISVIIPAGTSDIISFPQRFFRRSDAFMISNLDAANNATYQINGTSAPVLTLAAGAERVLNGAEIDLINVTAGAAGAVQIQSIGRPIVE